MNSSDPFCIWDLPGNDDTEDEDREDEEIYPEPDLFPGMTEEEIQDELDEDDEEDFWS